MNNTIKTKAEFGLWFGSSVATFAHQGGLVFGSRVHLVHLQLSRCFLELRLEKPLLFGVLRVQLLPLEGEAVLERSTRREVRRLLAKSEKKQNRVGGIRTPSQLNMYADFIY